MSSNELKKCSACRKNFDLFFFYKKRNGKYGRDSRCKSCVKKQKQRQYQYKTNQLNSMDIVQDSNDLNEEVVYLFLEMVERNED